MTDDTAARVLAQEGLRHIEQAILMLLDDNPQGLRNSQIADLLGLRSSIRFALRVRLDAFVHQVNLEPQVL